MVSSLRLEFEIKHKGEMIGDWTPPGDCSRCKTFNETWRAIIYLHETSFTESDKIDNTCSVFAQYDV